MTFTQRIESRKVYTRPCNCGRDHDAEIINGIFHYDENHHVIYIACLLEHNGERFLWIGFVTGAWPGIDSENCIFVIQLYVKEEKLHMNISPDDKMPLTGKELLDAYVLTREEILSQPGAKDWIIEQYQELLAADPYLWEYVSGNQA